MGCREGAVSVKRFSSGESVGGHGNMAAHCFARRRGWSGLAAFAIALLALDPTRLGAAEGIYLTWDDCALPGGGGSVKTSSCDAEIGSNTLLCGLVMPSAIDSVLDLEIVVDIQHEFPVLPDWWRFNQGACREGELAADTDFGPLFLCKDFWQTRAAGGVQSYAVGMPRGGTNQARIRVALNVPSDQPRSLNGTDMYYAARITLANVGTSACSGCSGAACLVLNSILVKRPPRPEGAPSTDVLVTTPGPGGANWAFWQATGPNCQAVPVMNRTWGEVKSLYR